MSPILVSVCQPSTEIHTVSAAEIIRRPKTRAVMTVTSLGPNDTQFDRYGRSVGRWRMANVISSSSVSMPCPSTEAHSQTENLSASRLPVVGRCHQPALTIGNILHLQPAAVSEIDDLVIETVVAEEVVRTTSAVVVVEGCHYR